MNVDAFGVCARLGVRRATGQEDQCGEVLAGRLERAFAESIGERLGDVALGDECFVYFSESSQRHIAKALAHRVPDEQRSGQRGRGDRYAQCHGQVRAPVVGERSNMERESAHRILLLHAGQRVVA